MSILILNGSPRKNGTVAGLLKEIARNVSREQRVEWVEVCDLDMRFCTACMKCRPDGECVLPEDDAHLVGRRIGKADSLVIGTPTHWGNMSSALKVLFDRNVPVFIGEDKKGHPIPRHKGKKAVMVTACSAPWPYNVIAFESRGALRSLKNVLHYGGYQIVGKVVAPGTKNRPEIDPRRLEEASKVGRLL